MDVIFKFRSDLTLVFFFGLESGTNIVIYILTQSIPKRVPHITGIARSRLTREGDARGGSPRAVGREPWRREKTGPRRRRLAGENQLPEKQHKRPEKSRTIDLGQCTWERYIFFQWRNQKQQGIRLFRLWEDVQAPLKYKYQNIHYYHLKLKCSSLQVQIHTLTQAPRLAIRSIRLSRLMGYCVAFQK